jgi:hypothetical protein
MQKALFFLLSAMCFFLLFDIISYLVSLTVVKTVLCMNTNSNWYLCEEKSLKGLMLIQSCSASSSISIENIRLYENKIKKIIPFIITPKVIK